MDVLDHPLSRSMNQEFPVKLRDKSPDQVVQELPLRSQEMQGQRFEHKVHTKVDEQKTHLRVRGKMDSLEE